MRRKRNGDRGSKVNKIGRREKGKKGYRTKIRN